ncbi:MAG: adenosylmethionine-8-amino-7-oxononanoate aminotransferase [Cytophagaceae bacterium]|jgi:adenosylmethionine-8-amino-7-oxononanoate aminotransferase|nr:adenosylmethionine-8-amino-7-oxononanoate aminotransferase [Cytophagaceae bacterium]
MSNWEHNDELIWHPYSSLMPVFPNLPVAGAKGAYIHLTDGRTILDGVSSWWVNLHGHGHPVLAEAIYQQALQLEHVIFAGFTHQPATDLAAQLIDYTACSFTKIFYSDNGSTAIEVALKMALQYWVNTGQSRHKIIALEGAFHGDTFGAMSVSSRSVFNKTFDSLMWEVDFIPFPFTEEEENCLKRFKELLAQRPAALIVEPLLQGTAGMRVYSPEFLDRLFAMAKQAGVICIADEVLTGFGRTGKPFASHYLKEKPDLMCLSKGLTGGTMPFGVTLANQKIVKAFDDPDPDKILYHGHSYTANPLACAVALASLKLLKDLSCTTAISAISDAQGEFAQRLKERFALKRVDHMGTIVSLELPIDPGYLSGIRNELYAFFLDHGVLLRPLGNVVYILPPYCIEMKDLVRIHKLIIELLETKGFPLKPIA